MPASWAVIQSDEEFSDMLLATQISDTTAAYAHRWTMTIAAICGVGLMLGSMFELQRMTEALVILVGAITGLIVALAIIYILYPIAAMLGSIPMFCILNWAGQKLLDKSFHLAHKPTVPQKTEGIEGEESDRCETQPIVSGDAVHPLGLPRLFPTMRRCLSISIAGQSSTN